MTFKELLAERLQVDTASQPAGLSPAKCIAVDHIMKAEHFAVPEEVWRFLKEVNGVVHNGIRFFGVDEQDPEKNLLSINQEMQELAPDFMEGRVVLGKSESYLYTASTDPVLHYERRLLPFMDADAEFPTFSSLLISAFSGRMDVRSGLGALPDRSNKREYVN